jgi:hypothetical protein
METHIWLIIVQLRWELQCPGRSSLSRFVPHMKGPQNFRTWKSTPDIHFWIISFDSSNIYSFKIIGKGNHDNNLESQRATIGSLLLGTELVNTPETIRGNRRRCFPWGPPRNYIKGNSKGAVSCCQMLIEFSWRRVYLSWLMSRIGSSSGDGSRSWLRRNDKKGIRRYKEDFMCELKFHDRYKSVARIRLFKTENPSACVTVNSTVCRISIVLYCL